MKVYFTTGYENPKKSKENIENILSLLHEKGHKVIKRPLKAEHGSNTYGVEEKQVRHIFDFIDRPLDKIYSEATARIRNADVVVAEASYYVSPGLGFELGYALNEKKPVVLLISSDSDIILSEVIEGNPSKLFSSCRYKNKEDLAKQMDTFFSNAKNIMDTKFILIISPEIDKYLEWAGAERRMHKAQVVREAIENMMNKDKDYKEFLKSID